VALNAQALSANIRRDNVRMLTLFAPTAVLVTVLLILPVGWLFCLSFVQNSQFSLAHYARMIEYSSYYRILITTFEISLIVTVVCAVLGYPVAYLIAQLPRSLALLCLALIIIPFWTSLLVRTYAWLVLLNANGPVNALILWLHLAQKPVDLLFNMTGAVIGMVHIMLPFFVLPLYAVIRSFDVNLIQAAASLGAPPVSAFLRVFLPLSLPGLFAGAVLVFIQSLGFYVTPAILGGGKVTVVAMKIADNVQIYFEWGAASAFGVVLLLCALGILLATARLLGLGHALGTARP
jgi:putative spermidine/putrescine transport system permease protein/spermidine/putrescine transport system permease protein